MMHVNEKVTSTMLQQAPLAPLFPVSLPASNSTNLNTNHKTPTGASTANQNPKRKSIAIINSYFSHTTPT